MEVFLRKGMRLTKKHVLMIAKYEGTEILGEVVKLNSGLYGPLSDPNPVKVEYDREMFDRCGMLSTYYDSDRVSSIIPAFMIEALDENQLFLGMKSGYLKHDSRGYYFDETMKVIG